MEVPRLLCSGTYYKTYHGDSIKRWFGMCCSFARYIAVLKGLKRKQLHIPVGHPAQKSGTIPDLGVLEIAGKSRGVSKSGATSVRVLRLRCLMLGQNLVWHVTTISTIGLLFH